MNTSQPAQHPNITSLKAQLRSKNVLFGDVMSRIFAVAQDTEAPGGPTCTGNLTIGIFSMAPAKTKQPTMAAWAAH